MATRRSLLRLTADPVLRGRHHWPGLDGLRALAVASVVLYHLGVAGRAGWDPLRPTGGFFGVDVFFALSGFLITDLLVREIGSTGRVSLRTFYVRRALRLLPALVAVSLVAALAAVVASGTWWRTGTLTGLPWVLLYVGNWHEAFAGVSALGLLDQTWSLAVEEQYYLVWPVLLVLGYRLLRRPGAMAAATLAAVGVVSVWRAVLESHHVSPERLYFATDTHCDGLLVGSALALGLWSVRSRSAATGEPAPLRRPRIDRTGPLALAGGLALVLIGLRLTDVPHSYLIGFPGTAAATCLIILRLSRGDGGWTARLLDLRPLVWLGRRSYGLYLWHPVIFDLIQWGASDRPAWQLDGPKVVLSVLVAGASYRWLEQPFLRLKSRAP